MPAEHDRTEVAIASLAVKREGPRFRLSIAVRLRREDLEGGLLEERTTTEDVGLSGAMVLTSAPFFEGDFVNVEELEGAFHVRARVVGATLAEDTVSRLNLSRLNLQFLGDDAAGRAGELLRRHGVLESGRLTLESEIPPSHPAKDAVENAVRDALQQAPGDWNVRIDLATGFSPPWWLVSFEGPAELFRMSFRPSEQNPELVSEHVREALMRRKLLE